MASKKNFPLILRFTKSIVSLLTLLALAGSVAAQETRRGFIDAIDCGTVTNPVIGSIICLQTVTIGGRTKGTLYTWDGTDWAEYILGTGLSSLNGLVSGSQSFVNDTNVTINSSGSSHTLGWTGQLSVARGGTSASTASGARIALGLAIGSDVQAFNSNLSALASESGTGLWKLTGPGTGDVAVAADIVALFNAGTCSGYLKSNGTCDSGTITELDPVVGAITGIVKANGAGVVSAAVAGTDYQGVDAELTALAGLTSAADRLPYFTGSGTAALATFTAFGRSLIDDADASAARTTLGLVINTDVQAHNANLAALAGLTSAADRLPYFTGSGAAAVTTFTAFGRSLIDDADAAAAIATLGLGTMATQSAGAVTITGGTITGIVDLAVADGGTGASTASGARSNLGLTIGSEVQAFDTELAALASVTSAADKLPYFTGSGTASVTTFTAFARTLLDDADAATMRTTLGLGSISTQASSSVSITGGTITGITDLAIADGGTGASTASGARTALGLVISTDIPSMLDVLHDLTYCPDSGSNDTYVCNTRFALDSYTTGTTITLKPNTVNTGAATVNVNSLGAKTIVDSGGSTLVDGAMAAGRFYKITYDGTNFRLAPGGSGSTLSGLTDDCILKANGTSNAECSLITDNGTTISYGNVSGNYYQDIFTTPTAVRSVNYPDQANLQIMPFGAYWDGGAITTDGALCADPTKQTLNSGPKGYFFSCADNNSSIFYGQVDLIVPLSTATFTLKLFHGTTETITFAGDFSAQCRAAGTAPNSTWGTAVAADVAITTANNLVEATTSSVTPNGTCAKGSTLFWRYVVDAANFSANAANAKVVSVYMEKNS